MSEAKQWEQVFPPITRDHLKAYSQASGDYNQIHLEDSAAQAIGLPGVIVHGMLVASLCSQVVRKAVGEISGSDIILKKIQYRFRAMTYPGDVLTAKVVQKSGSSQLEFSAVNQKGETVLTGKCQL